MKLQDARQVRRIRYTEKRKYTLGSCPESVSDSRNNVIGHSPINLQVAQEFKEIDDLK